MFGICSFLLCENNIFSHYKLENLFKDKLHHDDKNQNRPQKAVSSGLETL